MKNLVKIIKCIVFFIIGIFVFQTLTYIFVPKWMNPIDPATPRIKGFYLEEKNTIDVLVVGNSDVGRGYSPVTVWKEYGITSYNLGTSNQTMSLAYYITKEAIKYQKPEVLVLDMDATFVDYDAPEGEYRKLFDNMRLDEVKIEAINDEKIRATNKLSYIFPLLRFHSRWNVLEEKDLKKSLQKEYKEVSYKGMAMNSDIKPYVYEYQYMEEKGENATITEENLYYIDKIVELCRQENIKLLWIEFPSATSWSFARSKATTELAKKYGIEFIDYNIEPLRSDLGIDWRKHTADLGNHLNVEGAEIISKHIGEILAKNYNCPNQKDNETISKNWKKEVKRYEKNKKKLQETKK